MEKLKQQIKEKKKLIAISSWILMALVAETNFVFAAMSESYTLMGIWMVAAIGLAFAYIWQNKKKEQKIEPFIILYGIFWLYATIRFIYPLHHTDLFFYWTGFMMIFASSYYTGMFKKDTIFKFLKIMGFIFAVGVLLQFLFTDFFMENYFPLFGQEFQESIYRQVVTHKMYPGWAHQTMATCLNMLPALAAAVLLWKKDRKKQMIDLLFFFFMIECYLLTGRRGPLVFLVCTIIGVEILTSDSVKSCVKGLLTKAGLIAFSAVFLQLLLKVQAVFEKAEVSEESRNTIVRITETLTGEVADVSNGRYELWKLAGQLFEEHPLFGIGWRKYNLFAQQMVNEDSHVHNVFIQLAVEIGIIGLILYIIPIVYALWDNFKLYRITAKAGNVELSRVFKFTLTLQIYLFLVSLTESLIFYFSYQMLYCFVFCIYLAAKRDFRNTQQNIIHK